MTISIPYYSKDGSPLDPIEVDETLFGQFVRLRLLKEAVLMWETNQRVGTHSTKTRGEVAGSGAKPYRQKGTGRARAGSFQSPLWRGGGVVHGPRPRIYEYRMPKQKKRLALESALLAKLKDNEVVCIEALEFAEPKTKRARTLLGKLGIDGKCLVGLDGYDETAYKSFRNLPRIQIDEVRNFNPHMLIGGGTLVLTRAALDRLLQSRSKETQS